MAEKEKDLNHNCYICGISREKLDRTNHEGGFINHVKKKHYIWNYLYYMAYLQWKPETEFNGSESFVCEKIKNQDLSWFPSYKINNLQKDVNNFYKINKLSVIDKSMKQIKSDIEEIKGSFNRINE